MRWITTLCATGLMASVPLSAEASVCGATLLEGTPHRLYRQLRLTPRQATELQSIRYHSQRRQGRLESRLDQVRNRARRPANPHRIRDLERQAARLQLRLERESTLGVERIDAVLTPWQHRRCQAYLSHTRPRPVTAWVIRRHPRSEREQRRVIHRMAPRVDRTPGVAHRTPRRVRGETPHRVRRAPPVDPWKNERRRRGRRL